MDKGPLMSTQRIFDNSLIFIKVSTVCTNFEESHQPFDGDLLHCFNDCSVRVYSNFRVLALVTNGQAKLIGGSPSSRLSINSILSNGALFMPIFALSIENCPSQDLILSDVSTCPHPYLILL